MNNSNSRLHPLIRGLCHLGTSISFKCALNLMKYSRRPAVIAQINGIGLDTEKKIECKNVDIFLTISRNVCFECSKEPSHRGGSFEYPQHMFWLRNKKINF